MTAVNRIYGLGTFLESLESGEHFDGPTSNHRLDPRERVCALVPPKAANFRDFLEPGIGPLVVEIIDSWQCTTYTSCEGHPGPVPAPATVGILPLDDRQLTDLSRCADRVQRAVAEKVIAAVAFRAGRTIAEPAVGPVPVVELNFHPSGDWPSYFAELPGAIESVLMALRARQWVVR